MTVLLLTDLAPFLGRFHPLVVHLPIGFLLLAVLLAFLPGGGLVRAARVAWVAAALGAVASVGAGWLLASTGDYGGPELFWHRWGGVAVAVLAVGGYFVAPRGGWLARGYGLVTAAVLTVTGHLGGNLTHGSDYLLEHAPPVVQRLAGDPHTEAAMDLSASDPDSVLVFRDLLRPAIDGTCITCHRAGDAAGGLRLDTDRHLFLGGESGPLLLPGKGAESRWVQRVTLPPDHTKAMPPRGEGLTYTQIRLLEHWIDRGADTLARLAEEEVPADLQALLLRDYSLDLRPRLFVERLRGPALDSATVAGLRSLHWSISELTPRGTAVAARPDAGIRIDGRALRELAAAAGAQVTHLHLSRQTLAPPALVALADFPNLNTLDLSHTAATAAVVSSLAKLPHLESLNLYGTAVGDEIFTALDRLPALRRVYLWKTDVTPGAAAAFRRGHPDVDVNTGSVLLSPETTTK